MARNTNGTNFELSTVCTNTRAEIAEIKDETLKQNALTIQNALTAAEVVQGNLAAAFAATSDYIKENQDCGFKDIQDFGLRVFGIKKSQSYSLAVIGHHQTAVTDKKGKVLYYTDSFTDIPEKPYANTALQKILTYCNKYGEVTVTDFVKKNCSSDMSYRSLCDTLAKLDSKTKGLEQNPQNGEQNPQNGEQNGEQNPVKKETYITIQLPEKTALAMKNRMHDILANNSFEHDDMVSTLIDCFVAVFKTKSNSVKLTKSGYWEEKYIDDSGNMTIEYHSAEIK